MTPARAHRSGPRTFWAAAIRTRTSRTRACSRPGSGSGSSRSTALSGSSSGCGWSGNSRTPRGGEIGYLSSRTTSSTRSRCRRSAASPACRGTSTRYSRRGNPPVGLSSCGCLCSSACAFQQSVVRDWSAAGAVSVHRHRPEFPAQILRRHSGTVVAVLSGHDHFGGYARDAESGIHFVTLQARSRNSETRSNASLCAG